MASIAGSKGGIVSNGLATLIMKRIRFQSEKFDKFFDADYSAKTQGKNSNKSKSA
ncbi:MAG: hypothetical protein K9N21_12805 [Deltaproteobacteria bacterium]|nr:hypothetical protein [Deltaproteobacteria bacterium]